MINPSGRWNNYNSYAANNRAPKYMKKNPKLSEWKIAIIVGDLSIQPFLKLKWNSYKIKLTNENVQFRGIQYIHNVVQHHLY